MTSNPIDSNWFESTHLIGSIGSGWFYFNRSRSIDLLFHPADSIRSIPQFNQWLDSSRSSEWSIRLIPSSLITWFRPIRSIDSIRSMLSSNQISFIQSIHLSMTLTDFLYQFHPIKFHSWRCVQINRFWLIPFDDTSKKSHKWLIYLSDQIDPSDLSFRSILPINP